MPRFLVNINFGDTKELRQYVVYAPSIGEAAADAHCHALGVVEAEPRGQLSDDVPDDFYDYTIGGPGQ